MPRRCGLRWRTAAPPPRLAAFAAHASAGVGHEALPGGFACSAAQANSSVLALPSTKRSVVSSASRLAGAASNEPLRGRTSRPRCAAGARLFLRSRLACARPDQPIGDGAAIPRFSQCRAPARPRPRLRARPMPFKELVYFRRCCRRCLIGHAPLLLSLLATAHLTYVTCPEGLSVGDSNSVPRPALIRCRVATGSSPCS